MRFTVALAPEHRNTLKGCLGRAARGTLEWADTGPADVVIGFPIQGNLASCEVWPGKEGAAALIVAGFERWRDQRSMGRLNEVGRSLASEQNLDRLLDLILTQGRGLLQAEAGAIYLVVNDADGKPRATGSICTISPTTPLDMKQMMTLNCYAQTAIALRIRTIEGMPPMLECSTVNVNLNS